MLEGISAKLCWCSHLELDPARRKEWVHPPLMVLMLTHRGTGTLVIRNGGEHPIDEGEHSLFLLTPQIWRHVLSDADNPLAVLAVGIAAEFADGTDFFDRCRPALLEFPPEPRREIAAMIRELRGLYPVSGRTASVEMQLLTLRLCAAAAKFCPPRPEAELPRSVERCRKAVEFLSDHFTGEPDADALAAMCGMSRTLFFRIFRAETGMTPGEFRTCRRLREARKLLLQEKLSISEIANALGWESPFFFSRIFKRETGLSPRDFRRRRLLS